MEIGILSSVFQSGTGKVISKPHLIDNNVLYITSLKNS